MENIKDIVSACNSANTYNIPTARKGEWRKLISSFKIQRSYLSDMIEQTLLDKGFDIVETFVSFNNGVTIIEISVYEVTR